MGTNKSASLEARLKNNKDLVIFIRDYSKYQPTSGDIQRENYDSFVTETEAAMTGFRNSAGTFSTEKKNNIVLFENMTELSRAVRSEIGELKGTDSSQYAQVNSIVKLITGENIMNHSKVKKEKIKNLKDGDPQPGSSSVSQLDQKSMLGNFRSLIGIIRSFDFYKPADASISLASLEATEAVLRESLVKTAERETAYVNERSRILHYFNDKGGLRDRSKRARMQVKRKYGISSPEYKALVNKIY